MGHDPLFGWYGEVQHQWPADTHTITHDSDPVIALVMAGSFTVALITQQSIWQYPLGSLLLLISLSCLFISMCFILFTRTCTVITVFKCYFTSTLAYTVCEVWVVLASYVSAYLCPFHIDTCIQLLLWSHLYLICFMFFFRPTLCHPLLMPTSVSLAHLMYWDSWSMHCIHRQTHQEITTSCEPNAGKFAHCGWWPCGNLASLRLIGLWLFFLSDWTATKLN